jgi:hypothetical protein
MLPPSGDRLCRLGHRFVIISAIDVQPVGRLRKLQEGVDAGDHDEDVDRENLESEQGHPDEDVDDQALVKDEVDNVGEALIAMSVLDGATSSPVVMGSHRHESPPPAPGTPRSVTRPHRHIWIISTPP